MGHQSRGATQVDGWTLGRHLLESWQRILPWCWVRSPHQPRDRQTHHGQARLPQGYLQQGSLLDNPRGSVGIHHVTTHGIVVLSIGNTTHTRDASLEGTFVQIVYAVSVVAVIHHNASIIRITEYLFTTDVTALSELSSVTHFTDISFTVAISISLISIGSIGAVVASVAHTITIAVFLVGVADSRTIVTNIANVILIGVHLVTVGQLRAVIASIAKIITIAVQLIRVGYSGTVIANIAHLILIGIGLILVVHSRAVITNSPAPSSSS